MQAGAYCTTLLHGIPQEKLTNAVRKVSKGNKVGKETEGNEIERRFKCKTLNPSRNPRRRMNNVKKVKGEK